MAEPQFRRGEETTNLGAGVVYSSWPDGTGEAYASALEYAGDRRVHIF